MKDYFVDKRQANVKFKDLDFQNNNFLTNLEKSNEYYKEYEKQCLLEKK